MPKGVGVRVPPLAHNISDLAPKSMQANAGKALECRQIERRDMEKNEKCKAHPTRANIYIDQETGLLYRRRESGSFDMIPQKMTLHQELEDFRKADGVVRMTSRSRGRVAPQADQTPDEDHT